MIVDKILISQGDLVKLGDTLLGIKRVNAKLALQDETYKIERTLNDKSYFLKLKENELESISIKEESDLLSLNQKLDEYNLKLKEYNQLVAATGDSKLKLENNRVEAQIKGVKEEIRSIKSLNNEKRKLIQAEIIKGQVRYDSDIKLLNATIDHDNETKVIYDYLLAPVSGIVGDLQCKEGEHIPSFKTLMSLYEKNPKVVKGYIHETSKTILNVGEEVIITSVADPLSKATGKVTGIGSRIIDIPQRLRKVKDFVIYGKEVLIEVSPENPFLQKEKVSISVISE